jgi:ribosomal protein L18E
MKMSMVNINFKEMAIAFRDHVRFKAIQAGSNIVYLEKGQLIEENPKDSSKKVIGKLPHVAH